ncbi:hypothetical protein ScPMuIL_018434 [Solemya velum]
MLCSVFTDRLQRIYTLLLKPSMASRNNKIDESRDHAVQVMRAKNESAKKHELVRELHKLQVQVQAMEREKSTHLYSRRSEFREDYCQLEEMDKKFTDVRKSELIKLKQQLEKITHMVKRFHRELKDVKPTPEFVEKLKMIMEDIEGTINSFKEQQRHHYEELMQEERITSQDIQTLERKFKAWEQGATVKTAATNPSKPLASARDVTKDLPPEVAAFEKFLEQTGGPRGGWDEYDHQTFLKFRSRYKGQPVFIEHCLAPLPTRTEEEIKEHEEWYQEYLFLNETKKDSIKKWRAQKEEEKKEILTKATDDSVKEAVPVPIKETAEERMDRLGRLNAWKVQRELERAQEEERKLREKLTKAQKLEQERKKKTELKRRVDEYKKQKKEEEEFLQQQQEYWEQEEKERKRQLSAREIHKFRDRDQNKIQEKLAKARAKEEEEKERERRLDRLKSQVEVEVDRDPNRLYQPTAGWKARLKEVGPTGAGPMLHMPHRAVPSWRQGP